MSIKCITVPPRMNPSGFASFGNTTCTISVAESADRFGVIRSGGVSLPHRFNRNDSTCLTRATALSLLRLSDMRLATMAWTVVLAAGAFGDPIAQTATVATAADLQEALNR